MLRQEATEKALAVGLAERLAQRDIDRTWDHRNRSQPNVSLLRRRIDQAMAAKPDRTQSDDDDKDENDHTDAETEKARATVQTPLPKHRGA